MFRCWNPFLFIINIIIIRLKRQIVRYQLFCSDTAAFAVIELLQRYVYNLSKTNLCRFFYNSVIIL